MKLTELKKVLKETVREVIQEELKDILLEAVKSPKVVSQTPIVESFTQSSPKTTHTTLTKYFLPISDTFTPFSKFRKTFIFSSPLNSFVGEDLGES